MPGPATRGAHENSAAHAAGWTAGRTVIERREVARARNRGQEPCARRGVRIFVRGGVRSARCEARARVAARTRARLRCRACPITLPPPQGLRAARVPRASRASCARARRDARRPERRLRPSVSPPFSPAPPPSRTGTLALPATPTLAPSGRPVAGYVARQDSLPAADPALLKGKRVAIDPGHGGYFRGCMGVNGLSEAEVNLGVALRLRELLVARGATVLMTRDRDRDFLSPPTVRSSPTSPSARGWRTRSRPTCSCRCTTTPTRPAGTT